MPNRLAIALTLTLLATPSHAAVASVAFGAYYSQWVVAPDGAALDDAISYLEGEYGPATEIRIRCDGSGWLAYYFDADTQAGGYACGFDSSDEASGAAEQECWNSGGTSCTAVHIRYDNGHFQMDLDETDPLYYLDSAL
jgi:hypothetical protein